MIRYTLLVGMLSVAISTLSAPTLEWSKDLSSIVTTTDGSVTDCRGFADGSVLLVLSPNTILLLDKDGNKLFESVVSGASDVSFADFAHSTDRFALSINYPTIRVYYKSGDTYEYSDITPINVEIGGDGGHPANDLYSLSGSILSKYSTEAESPSLVPSTSGMQDSNFLISWESRSNLQYEIQKSTSLTSLWTSVGSPIIGTGETINWSTPTVSTNVFFRVVLK